MYSYDQFSNLVSAKESGFETIFRSTDIVGNLYETKDCSDRIYGAGSRLEKSCINLKEKRNKCKYVIIRICPQLYFSDTLFS